MTNEQAISWLKNYRKYTSFEMPQYEDALDMAIQTLQAEPKWTPCSERMPEVGKQYLCCDSRGFREVGYLSTTTKDWHFADNDTMEEIVAWMPLPSPWEGVSE